MLFFLFLGADSLFLLFSSCLYSIILKKLIEKKRKEKLHEKNDKNTKEKENTQKKIKKSQTKKLKNYFLFSLLQFFWQFLWSLLEKWLEQCWNNLFWASNDAWITLAIYGSVTLVQDFLEKYNNSHFDVWIKKIMAAWNQANEFGVNFHPQFGYSWFLVCVVLFGHQILITHFLFRV